MSDASQRIFCAEQINVPPELPSILKAFTKEARTHHNIAFIGRLLPAMVALCIAARGGRQAADVPCSLYFHFPGHPESGPGRPAHGVVGGVFQGQDQRGSTREQGRIKAAAASAGKAWRRALPKRAAAGPWRGARGPQASSPPAQQL